VVEVWWCVEIDIHRQVKMPVTRICGPNSSFKFDSPGVRPGLVGCSECAGFTGSGLFDRPGPESGGNFKF